MSNSREVRLAVDLGASSGRVLAASLDDRSIELEEVHRFSNGPLHIGKRLHWDSLALWSHIELGLTKAAATYGSRIQSVGVDTWGVDYMLLDKHDDIVGPAFCYRDPRTNGMFDKAFARLSRRDIFSETGLQFMEINTAYQLLAMREEGSPLLDIAEHFLMTPDFFHWLLTGEKSNERTNASTTQLLRPQDGKWSTRILKAFEIPEKLFLPCVQSGTMLGPIKKDVAQRTGLHSVQTIIPATHDTAAAIVAVPASEFAPAKPRWCYISSGTWSLMGVELASPNLTDKCSELNFTNEGGVQGSTRLLKNISGLWPYQQCRAAWQRQNQEYSWSQLTAMAAVAKPLQSFFDPNDPSLVAPENMVAAIQQLYRKHQQPILEGPGSIARSALESLVMRYRMCLDSLEELLGYRIETIHIVGGGVQNELLCQMTADATKRPVIAGPVEATALGNIVTQCLGNGRLQDIAAAREWIRRSCDIQQYHPKESNAWDEAYARFAKLMS
ncbi:MAG: rhamnulokinase family protein [Pirellulaceae bacterium]|nr:rhamnulokinase family protein [Pirellulaceae bacterium]